MNQTEADNYDLYYVARQPILDRRSNTYGYELLFRDSEHHSRAEFHSADQATISVSTCGFISSQESIDQSKRLFINFTEKLILEGSPRALPPAVVVIEVLEDILPSVQIMEELIRLKQDGYLIAIDDYVGSTDVYDLLDIADIIKVDVYGKTKPEIEDIFQSIRDKKALKLAEKVESGKEFLFLRELGFDLFQGYFFARPETLSGKNIKPSFASKLNVLNALDNPSLDTDQLVDLINGDPSITYRLLRLLNSAAFGFSMKITSVRHSVILLGNTRVRYWLRMAVLSDMLGNHKPGQLLVMALNRGKLLEELAIDGLIPDIKPETLFLFGMLSLLDVILDAPFSAIFHELPLPDTFQSGYTDPAAPLAVYLRLLEALEGDRCDTVREICQSLNIQVSRFSEAVIRANVWTDTVTGALL
jgi:EAL and modified HD-GYP domain-containing signal transduction protein